MQVEFLGTAGYHPNETRHTSCIYVPDAAPDAAFVLDAGTGFFRLIGRDLPAQLHVFLSHAHLDHVQGLTYLFNVTLHKKCEVTLHGSAPCLDAVSKDLFDSPLFPLPFIGKMHVLEVDETFSVGGVRITVFPLTHPGGSLGYRFDWPDKSLAYVTDTAGDGTYIDFIRGADLLVHERNFTNDLLEVADASGHCTADAVARVATKAEVKTLVLTHFNPLEEDHPADEGTLHAERPDAVFAHDGLVLEF